MRHTGNMERDPDYIDPSVLKRRAAISGGAGARSGRPTVRRVADEPSSAVHMARQSDLKVADVSIVSPGVRVSTSVRAS